MHSAFIEKVKRFSKSLRSTVESLNPGDILEVKPIDILEVIPQTDYKGNLYTGMPLYYVICLAENGERLKVKVKQHEFFDYVASKDGLPPTVTIQMNEYTEYRNGNYPITRKFLTLHSWG